MGREDGGFLINMKLPDYKIQNPVILKEELINWARKTKPTQIECTDKEYAALCTLMGSNVLFFEGVPIVFLEGKI